jgi:hypothetical protein
MAAWWRFRHYLRRLTRSNSSVVSRQVSHTVQAAFIIFGSAVQALDSVGHGPAVLQRDERVVLVMC